jgi:Zn-dependent M16 (insulinase) family peptidase
MEFVESRLDKFEPISVKPSDLTVKKWESPRSVETIGPVDACKNLLISVLDPAKQNRVAISYLANDTSDFLESLTMRIVADLLLDGAASPMYKALIESKLGTDYAPTTGYSPYTFTSSISFGLQGVAEINTHKVILLFIKVKEIIQKVLEDTFNNGFPKSRIESVFHQIQLGLKHVIYK